MSQPNKILSLEECQIILQRWQNGGLTDEEHEEFVMKASASLLDSTQASELEDKIRESARLAKEIDTGFSKEETLLEDLAETFRRLGPLLEEWRGLMTRWKDCLHLSIQLATDTSDILQQFDTIYLAQVENIQTEQDRLVAIADLEKFLVVLNTRDRSAEMSRMFLDLKRDVYAFNERFPVFAQTEIVQLATTIEALDKQIKAVQDTAGHLGGGLLMRATVGTGISDVLTSLKFHRQENAKVQEKFYQAFTNTTTMVAPRVRQVSRDLSITDLKSDYWPDNLLEFAEIWSSVRSQNVQFSTHIKGGLAAATNLRFKAEVKLAREVCTPLRADLQEYKQQLQSLV